MEIPMTPYTEMEPKQHFTGYWIPKELTTLGLSKIEQMLLAMIDSLTSPYPDFCFASNKYLGKHMDLSESRISFYITKFKRMKLIEEVGFDGRYRRMRTLKQNWFPVEGDSKKVYCVKTRRQTEKPTEKPVSKKVYCVNSRTRTARKHEGSMRENTNHIEQEIQKEIKNNNLSVVVASAPPSNDQKSQDDFSQNEVVEAPTLPVVEEPKKEEPKTEAPVEEPKAEEPKVVEAQEAVAEAIPSKALVLQPDGTHKEVNQTELFMTALSKKTQFSTETLQKAWIVLCKYKGVVHNWWRFIEGTSENIEKKNTSEKIIEPKKCYKTTKIQKKTHTEESSKGCNKISSGKDSSEHPSQKLVLVGSLLPPLRYS